MKCEWAWRNWSKFARRAGETSTRSPTADSGAIGPFGSSWMKSTPAIEASPMKIRPVMPTLTDRKKPKTSGQA